MAIQSDELIDLYRRRARRYDLSANLYYLIGFRERRFRKNAVAALKLEPGDTVVEIGCGTGLNFALLKKAVGEGGRIIGVDLTDAMLVQAQKRIEKQGWANVELVRSDAAAFPFPNGIQGVLSTFALSLVPEYGTVMGNGAAALAPGRRLVVGDLTISQGWTRVLAPLLLPLARPFGPTWDIAQRKPWESMERYLNNVTVEKYYGRFA